MDSVQETPVAAPMLIDSSGVQSAPRPASRVAPRRYAPRLQRYDPRSEARRNGETASRTTRYRLIEGPSETAQNEDPPLALRLSGPDVNCSISWSMPTLIPRLDFCETILQTPIEPPPPSGSENATDHRPFAIAFESLSSAQAAPATETRTTSALN